MKTKEIQTVVPTQGLNKKSYAIVFIALEFPTELPKAVSRHFETIGYCFFLEQRLKKYIW